MRWKVWEPKECLCGFGPRTASFIMGLLGVIGWTSYIVAAQYFDEKKFCDFRGSWTNCSSKLMVLKYLTVSTSSLTLLASMILIVGVWKKIPKLILVYLAVKTFTIAFYGTATVGLIIYLFVAGFRVLRWILPIEASLGIFLDVYFFLCVRVYYRMLVDPDAFIIKDHVVRRLPPPSEMMKFAKIPTLPI